MAAGVVGRAAELARLTAFLDGISARSAVLAIEGEAGIGKSTLWSATVDAARARGWAVLVARPVSGEAVLGYAGLGDLLDEVGDDACAALPGPLRRALDVALLRAEASAPPDARAIAVATRQLIVDLAAAAPVLVAVDDAQWLDAATAQVLLFTARRLPLAGAGVLTTVRREHGAAAPPGRDPATVLAVGPLPAAELVSLLEASDGAPVARATIDRAVAAAGGNPLYARELVAALGPGGSVAHGDAGGGSTDGPAGDGHVPVPASLHELVTARIATLPPDTRDALGAVAALARPTPAALTRAGVLDALAAAETAGVVTAVGDRYRFTHPLLAAAAYGAIPAGARPALHQRLAVAVDDPVEAARHLALATPGPDAAVAAALDTATAAAAERAAWTTAVELARLALARTPDADPARWARVRTVADVAARLGDRAGAAHALHELAAAAPDPAQRADAVVTLAEWATADDPRAAAALADEVADGPVRGRAALVRARVALDRDLAEADGWVAAAGEAPGADAVRARVAFLRAEPVAGPAPTPSRAPAVADAVLLGRTLAEADELGRARTVLREAVTREVDGWPAFAALAAVERWAGRWDVAEDAARRAHRLAAERSAPVGIGWATAGLGWIDALRGDTRAAAAAAASAVAVADETGDRSLAVDAHALAGVAAAWAGDSATARPAFVAADAAADRLGVREPGARRHAGDAVEVLLALGARDAARAALDRLEAAATATGRPSAGAAVARGRALCLADDGDRDGALASLDAGAAGLADRYVPFEAARIELVRGQVHRRAKEKAAARDALGRALAAFEALGAAGFAERTRAELSRVGAPSPSPLGLTATERRVAELAATGLTVREVAAQVFLSAKTVEANLTRVYRKLGVRNRTELAGHLARQRGAS